MRASNHNTRLLIAVVAALAATPARGQFPSQQDGHALDANPQLGAYGRNAPIAGPGAPINYGNLIVSGNVTQGRSFRGFSPIRDISTFANGLPSAGISNFARDTVSAGQFLQGGTTSTVIRPQPFFAVEQTVPTAGAVASGLYPLTRSPFSASYENQNTSYFNPGQTPYSTQYQALEDTRIIDRGSALRPEILTLDDAPTGTRAAANPMLMRSQLLATNRGLADRAASPLGAEVRPFGFDDRNLFNDSVRMGVPEELDHTGLDADARDDLAGIGGEDPRQVLSNTSAAAGLSDVQRVQEPVDPRVQLRLDENGVYQIDRSAVIDGVNNTSNLPTPQDRNAVPHAGGAALGRSSGAPPTGQPDIIPPPISGQDSGELMRSFVPKPILTEAAPDALRQPVIGTFEPPTAEPPALVAGDIQSQSDLIEPGGPDPSRLLNQPVKTFAGADDTRINEYLRAAEQYLQSEQYYRAAALYEMATMIDPKNPLVWLGHGNALIAAGDYRSAIRSLLRGIELFEDIAFFQMNLHDFIPDASLLEGRRANLESQLTGRENAESRFLLGYIEYYTGLKTFGMDNLRKAAEAAPLDSTIARFPKVLAEATGSDVER